MKADLPPRRYTSSLEHYWQDMFNELAAQEAEHAMSGWSVQGLRLRMQAYLKVLPQLALRSGARVLDLGCGAGSYSRVLGEAGFEVLGVDFASRVVQEARNRTHLGHVHYLSAEACTLPFADASFGHVLCIGLLQSLDRHEGALAEMCRVLEPEGSLCLMTLNRRSLKVRLDQWLGRQEIIMVDGRAQPRLKTYHPADLVQSFERLGMAGLMVAPVQIFPERWSRIHLLMKLLDHIPGVRFLTARSFLVTAVKKKDGQPEQGDVWREP